jgi:hypothetical protein
MRNLKLSTMEWEVIGHLLLAKKNLKAIKESTYISKDEREKIQKALNEIQELIL